MVFSYNWLQSFFKKKLPAPKKLAELLTLHFAEVEELKKDGKDFILDIDIKPNRAGDCFSHLGVAREIAAILNLKLQVPISKSKEDKKPSTRAKHGAGPVPHRNKVSGAGLKAKDFISVEVKHKWACPRYTARVIIDVKVGPSPVWLKERLKVCGLRPINNIVDIANFVMLETGQPLHAFDGEKLDGNPEGTAVRPYGAGKIIVRFAKTGEKITTLDGEKYNLDDDILVIADSQKPVAIAGIKGGKLPEIDKKTKVVVLESANFNSQIIRRGSRKLNLRTDASLRFEHGIDPNLTEFGISRAAYLIQKIAKGKVVKGLIDIYPKKTIAKRINLDLSYLKSLLGVEIPKKEIINIFKRLQFQCAENTSRYLGVKIPTFRLDISIPEDLIEEVGRIYGYEKIPAIFPVSALIPPKKNYEIFWEETTKNILKEAGFSEVYNYSFISEKDKNIFGDNNLVELENPLSLDFKYLRASLIPNLLKNIQKNQKPSFHYMEAKVKKRTSSSSPFKNKIKIFELGKIFRKNNGKGDEDKSSSSPFAAARVLEEKRMLTATILGEEFYQLKGVIDLLLNKIGISDIWYDNYKPTPEESKLSLWHSKKCAEVKIGQEEIGFLGELSSKITENLKLAYPIVIFDLDFEKLAKLASEEHEFRPIPKYPSAVRDLAILVPLQTRVEEVLNIMEITGGVLVRDIDLFDIYEGEELPEGKKNLAFHLIYQSETRTLSSKEIDEIHNKIIKTLESEPEWQVRR